jgi:transcriptional regulator with XRE-family HTH domain
MEDVRIGARVRALRHRLGWRQADLAAKAGVSQDLVSRIERGRLEGIPLREVRRVVAALDAQLVVGVRWRGGDLDRLIDEGHAALAGRAIRLLGEAGWEVRAEVSYSIYGERGSIDLLAWHPPTRSLLVVEIKTAVMSIEETIRKHDQKARLAGRIAIESLGWRPASVSRLLVLPDQSTARRRVQRHDQVMATAYPTRTSNARTWLRVPAGVVSALIFVPIADRTRVAARDSANAGGITRRRVRLSRADRGTISR